jgi:hypothetical protein
MAPIEDILHHAEAAEALAAWLGGHDRTRLLEIAADLRRRAAGRERLWFWMPATATAARQVSDLTVDETWRDPESVRFTLDTATGPATFEAPRALLPRMFAQLAGLSRGEPPNFVVLDAAQWWCLSGRGGQMALQVDLREGGSICLPIDRPQAAKLLSWLGLALGGLRLRQPRLREPEPPPARRPIRFHLVHGEAG